MRVSFIHGGGPHMASYRYRAAMPAASLGASMNDPSADVLIFAKPHESELSVLHDAKMAGQVVIVDLCDDHLDRLPWYMEFLALADHIVCNTPVMAERIGAPCTVITDPYEFEEVPPHGCGSRVLWYGHKSNLPGLQAILPSLSAYKVTVISNAEGCRVWSHETMREAFAAHDLVILPPSAPYKSANRAVEAIRQGCFVVAAPHPALTDIPGIWLGDLQEGLAWASTQWSEANARTRLAQDWIREPYSPATQAAAWRSLLRSVPSPIIWAPERFVGRGGRPSIPMDAPMCPAISGNSPYPMPPQIG